MSNETHDMATLMKVAFFDSLTELFDSHRERVMEAIENADDSDQLINNINDLYEQLADDEDGEEDGLEAPDDSDFSED
jgi:hypothetical protein